MGWPPPTDAPRAVPEYLDTLVEDEGIEPHIPVFAKSERQNGAFPATDFECDHEADEYTCPGGKTLKPFWRKFTKERPEFGKVWFKKYPTRKGDCAACALKARCTPKQETRRIIRSRNECARKLARDIARTAAYVSSSYARKKVEMSFAHLKRMIGPDRLRLRGPNAAKDEFHLAAMVQNLRKLAKLVPSPA